MRAESLQFLRELVEAGKVGIIGAMYDVTDAYIARWKQRVLAGGLLIAVTGMRPMHPKWIELYGQPGTTAELGQRRKLRRAGWLLMLLPFTALMIYESVPFVLYALRSGEMSGSAGGLIIWPTRAFILAGLEGKRLHPAPPAERSVWLRRAYEQHEMPLTHVQVAWDWDFLREDAGGFRSLLHDMNLTQ